MRPRKEDFSLLQFSQYLSKLQNDKANLKSNLASLGSLSWTTKNVLLKSPLKDNSEINYIPSKKYTHVKLLSHEKLQLSHEILSQQTFLHSSKSQFSLKGPLPMKIRHTYTNSLGIFNMLM